MNIDWFKRSDLVSESGLIGRTLKQGVGAFFRVFGDLDTKSYAREKHAMLVLIREVIAENGIFSLSDVELIREQLEEHNSPLEVDRMLSELRSLKSAPVDEAAETLLSLPMSERERVIGALLSLAIGKGTVDEKLPLLKKIAEILEVKQSTFDAILNELSAIRERRQKIIRSGAGILVALIVLAVFILTATLLRSVIFGLIAAYLLLPVEKCFERKLRSGKGFLFRLFQLGGMVTAPLHRLSAALSRRGANSESSLEDQAKRKNQTVIAQAVGTTTVLLLILTICVVSIVSSVANHYVHNWSESVRTWTNDHLTSPSVSGENSRKDMRSAVQESEIQLITSSSEQALDKMRFYLEQLRIRFENLPMVKFAVEQISNFLNQPEAQRELVGILLKRTGGIFSFTASVLGFIGALIADLLLTAFFFLLFLTKIAEFCAEGESAGRQNEYLVRTVFNGNWLPGASPETIAEAQRIIGEVINKLRVWVRGYITLMLVDGTVYTTVFYFLHVPYFWALGPLAGCGILLPYIGPIISALLTILVTLAVGGAQVEALQILGIACAYLLYNGILEQFILYPMVIGESLGLTTLETIIVVLLGAIFAGIPGMLLAIPTASVIKYLVPQIYRCWESK